MKELTEERDKMAATYYDILQGKMRRGESSETGILVF